MTVRTPAIAPRPLRRDPNPHTRDCRVEPGWGSPRGGTASCVPPAAFRLLRLRGPQLLARGHAGRAGGMGASNVVLAAHEVDEVPQRRTVPPRRRADVPHLADGADPPQYFGGWAMLADAPQARLTDLSAASGRDAAGATGVERHGAPSRVRSRSSPTRGSSACGPRRAPCTQAVYDLLICNDPSLRHETDQTPGSPVGRPYEARGRDGCATPSVERTLDAQRHATRRSALNVRRLVSRQGGHRNHRGTLEGRELTSVSTSPRDRS